jgi:nitrogen regulatory protein P-II 2
LDTVTLKLVTIVAERILKDRVVEDVLNAGARGYTISDAYGKGSRGVRASEWEGPDVKVEAVVSQEVADRILKHVSTTYFKHYAVIAYTETVEVVRGDKYI